MTLSVISSGYKASVAFSFQLSVCNTSTQDLKLRKPQIYSLKLLDDYISRTRDGHFP